MTAAGFDPARVAAVAARLDDVDADFRRAVLEPTEREALRLKNVVKNLKLGARVDLRPMSAGDLDLDGDAEAGPACATCQDRCCADPDNEVSLRLLDLWRFREAGLLFAVQRSPPRSPERYRRLPVLADAEGRDTYLRFPTLAKQPSGACMFYGDDGKCGVWDLRPLVCRSFPHRPEVEDPRTVGYSRRCGSRRPFTGGEERARILVDVAEVWRAKVQDLVTLEHGRRALEETGLSELLPRLEG